MFQIHELGRAQADVRSIVRWLAERSPRRLPNQGEALCNLLDPVTIAPQRLAQIIRVPTQRFVRKVFATRRQRAGAGRHRKPQPLPSAQTSQNRAGQTLSRLVEPAERFFLAFGICAPGSSRSQNRLRHRVSTGRADAKNDTNDPPAVRVRSRNARAHDRPR